MANANEDWVFLDSIYTFEVSQPAPLRHSMGELRPYQNIAPLPSSGAKEWHLVVFRRLGEGNEILVLCIFKTTALQF